MKIIWTHFFHYWWLWSKIEFSLFTVSCVSENHQVVLTKEWSRNEPGHSRQFGLDHGIFKTLTGIPSLFRTTANIFFGLRGILTQLRGRLGSSAPLGPRWSDNAGLKSTQTCSPKISTSGQLYNKNNSNKL